MGKNHKNNKHLKRSTLSGKRVENKEVITTDEAIDYVKKQGFFVFTRNQVDKIRADGIRALQYLIILVISFAVLMPLVSPKLIDEITPSINYNNISNYNVTNINLTGIDWADAINGTLYLSSNPYSFYNISNFNINNYYLKDNPFNFYNITSWNNPYAYYNISNFNISNYLLKTGDNATGNYLFNGNVNVTKNTSLNNFIFLNSLNSATSGSASLCLSKGAVTTSGSTCQVSSVLYKENIIPLESVINRFMLITPERYNYINDFSKTQRIGLIAEDLGNQFPELLVYDTNNKIHTYDSLAINGIFVRVIQEQQQELNSLKSELCLYSKLLYSWC